MEVDLDTSTAAQKQALLTFTHTAALCLDTDTARKAAWKHLSVDPDTRRGCVAEADRLHAVTALFANFEEDEDAAPHGDACFEPLADDDDGADSEAGGPVEEAEEATAMVAPVLATPIALTPESRPMLTRLQALRIVYGARFC